MAERRMFARSIIDSDTFLDMPTSTQLLYFHLGMRADDDGFVNNPKKIQRMINVSEDDLKILVAKKFIIPFDSGVVVIKHWRIHNYIRKDMYHETNCIAEKSMLDSDNGGYSLRTCNELVTKPSTQVRLGKDSIGKDSILPPYNPPLAEKETVLSVIENYSAYGKIVSLLKEFVELRQKKKKPLTVRAIKMALNELDKLAGNDDRKKEAIINQTILHAWDSFYQLKEEPKTNLSHEEFIAQTAARILAKQKAEKERRLNGC